MIKWPVPSFRADTPNKPYWRRLLVGAPYWEPARYERALAVAQSDGLVVRTAEGLFSSV